MICEAWDGPFDLRESPVVLRRRPPIGVTDCKSLYDHVISMSSPAVLDDRRSAIDVAIIRQSIQRSGLIPRWCPTDRQLADALTKDGGDPTDLLRACMRQGVYQLSSVNDLMEKKALEKILRKERGAQRALAAS